MDLVWVRGAMKMIDRRGPRKEIVEIFMVLFWGGFMKVFEIRRY